MGFIKRLFGQQESAEEIAEAVIYTVGKDAFIRMRNKEFRRLLDVNNLDKDKQVNVNFELEISGAVLAYLTIESLEKISEHETTKESFRTIKNFLTLAFLKYTKQDAPDSRGRQMAIRLLAQRCEDCREAFERRKHELKSEDLKRNYWPGICAENCLNYLLAGQPPSELDQEIFDHLGAWNMYLAHEIERAILKRSKVTRMA